MRQQQRSQTAAWVAAARSAGQLLPKAQQLASDPYGIAFVEGALQRLTQHAFERPELFRRLLPRLSSLEAFLLWMQLRTRALDDVLREFIASGGRQVVLLGAGYDCRGVRFAHLLGDANLFEVDHPATQAHKVQVVSQNELRSPARYVAWDFERHGLIGLGARLAQEGLSPNHRVLTIWEGVTMYLSESTVEETFLLVRGYGARGSWLAFNYLDRRALHEPSGDQRITQRLTRLSGEPHRFGWDPPALPGWLAKHHYTLMWDLTDYQLAKQLLDDVEASPGARERTLASHHFTTSNRHVALATT